MQLLIRRTVAVGAGVGAATVVTVACAVGIVRGPGAWILVFLAVLAIPTSRSLSRRVALNFAIVIGLVPILWWVPWEVGSAGRAGAICGVLVGAVLCLVLWSSASRATVLPRLRSTDLLVAALVPVVAVLYSPFFTADRGAAAVAMLTRGTGGDNLSHFDIFEMIRRTGVALSWSGSAGVDSNYALASYPQHFHTLAVFGAELWGGPAVESVDREAGLYGIGMVFALCLGFVAVVAAMVSLPSLRRRPLFATIAATLVVSFLMLGIGATLLGYGFPNFILSVCVTAVGLLIVGSPRPMSLPVLVAVSATVISVAHTWSLLVPLVGLGLLIAVARLPWRSYRHRPGGAIAPIAVILATGASCAYAAVLVFRATGGGASSAGALETPGDIPPNPLFVTLVCVLGVAILGMWLLRRSSRRGFRGSEWVLAMTAFLFSVTALVMSGVLIALQLQHRHQLGYYQYKFLDAVLLVSVAIGISIVAYAVPRTTRVTTQIRPALRVALGAGLSLVVVLLAGLPIGTPRPSSGFALPAVTYRDGLIAAQSTPPLSAADLISAATVMAENPCFRPIFVATFRSDLSPDLENTRAMALSGRWTQDTHDIDVVLRAARPTANHRPQLGRVVDALLAGRPERCVVISPAARGALSSGILNEFGGQIVSWTSSRTRS